MLVLRNIIITLLLLTLLGISVVGLMIEAPPVFHWTPERLHQLGHSVVQIMRPGLLLFWLWWVLFLGTLTVFFITVARPRRRMKIEVQMGGGRVVIMDAAIKRYVRNALAELHGVTIKKMDLREHRGQVTTDIFADVRTRENLPTLERRIISKVRNALAEDLGITNLGDVHVFIKSFELTGRPGAKAHEPEPAPEPEPVEPAETVPAADIVLNKQPDPASPSSSINEETLAAEAGADAASPAVAETRTLQAGGPDDAAPSPLTFPGEEAAPFRSASDTDTAAAGASAPEEEPLVLDTDASAEPTSADTDLDPVRPWDKFRTSKEDGDNTTPGSPSS